MSELMHKSVTGCHSPSRARECSEEDQTIKIDVDLIPDHVRENLAASIYESIQEFLREPGGREFLDRRKAERRQRLKG